MRLFRQKVSQVSFRSHPCLRPVAFQGRQGAADKGWRQSPPAISSAFALPRVARLPLAPKRRNPAPRGLSTSPGAINTGVRLGRLSTIRGKASGRSPPAISLKLRPNGRYRLQRSTGPIGVHRCKSVVQFRDLEAKANGSTAGQNFALAVIRKSPVRNPWLGTARSEYSQGAMVSPISQSLLAL